jgi:elongation factor P hydroxylase
MFAWVNFVAYEDVSQDWHEVAPVTFATKEEAETHDPSEWFLDRSQAADQSQVFEVREVVPKATSYKDEAGQTRHTTYFDIV